MNLSEDEKKDFEALLNNELKLEKMKQGLKTVLVCEYDYWGEIDSTAISKFEQYKIAINVKRVKNIEDGKKTIRHEARHFWQFENYRDHVEWWRNNGDYYDLLYAYSMEDKEIFTIEKDAESYAEAGNTSYE